MSEFQETLKILLPMTYHGYIDLLRRVYDFTYEGYRQGAVKDAMLSAAWLDPDRGILAFVQDIGPCPSDCERRINEWLH